MRFGKKIKTVLEERMVKRGSLCGLNIAYYCKQGQDSIPLESHVFK